MAGFILGALGSLAAATAASWASMDSKSQLYGRSFVSGLRSSQESACRIALTYDDGPNEPHTLHLLEVLERHQVRATFFMIGRYVREHPEIVRAVAAAGHEIGNHTETHPNLIFCSAAQIEREIRECEAALAEALGTAGVPAPQVSAETGREPGAPTGTSGDGAYPVSTKIFRPPFGGRRPAVLRIARRLGHEPVMWSVSARDWTLPSASAIEQQVSSHIRGGDVVLMHDGGHLEFGADRHNTVAATDALIRKLKESGREFVTVGKMMASARETAEPR